MFNLNLKTTSMSGFKRNLPPVPVPTNASSEMVASWVPYGETHKWKKLGVVVLHDKNADITLHEFDYRYRGKKSRFGRYLRELHAKGVDISPVLSRVEPLEKEKEELALVMAKRLYEALAKRTAFKRIECRKCGIKPGTIIKKDENWDWKHAGVKHSKYYKMAVRILSENDHETAIRIVNTITGYA